MGPQAAGARAARLPFAQAAEIPGGTVGWCADRLHGGGEA